MRVNSKDNIIFFFRIKFNREPKQWSIEDLHNLYLKAKERSEKRQKLLTDCGKRILAELQPEDRDGSRYAYFYREEYHKKECITSLYRYRVAQVKRRGFDSFSWSTERVDSTASRDDKLSFILANERAFELGEEFKKIQSYRTSYHHYIWNEIWNMAEKKLDKIYKDKEVPTTIKLKIGDKEYLVVGEDNLHHIKWKFLGEYNQETIEL